MGNLVVSGTPWEQYLVNGVIVHVKREDLSCPPPGPSFSKIRGLEMYLKSLPSEVRAVGVLDTVHSKAGWGAAYICQALGLTCYNFYPVYKSERMDGFDIYHYELREYQKRSLALGAQLRPLAAGRSSVIYHAAKQALSIAAGNDDECVMLPNGLKLQETVDATAAEIEEYTPDELFGGTWIVSISSGTICAGLVKALEYEDVEIVAHMGYSRSRDAARGYIERMSGVLVPDIWLVDEGYKYKDKVDVSCLFPCNPYYDLKAWKWLEANVHKLKQPIVFWNIGD